MDLMNRETVDRALEVFRHSGWENLIGLVLDDHLMIYGLLHTDLLNRLAKATKYKIDRMPSFSFKWVRDADGTIKPVDPAPEGELKEVR